MSVCRREGGALVIIMIITVINLLLGEVERRFHKYSLGFAERHLAVLIDITFVELGVHLLPPVHNNQSSANVLPMSTTAWVRLSSVYLCVCLFFSHDISKTDAARKMTDIDIQMFHDEP